MPLTTGLGLLFLFIYYFILFFLGGLGGGGGGFNGPLRHILVYIGPSPKERERKEKR